MCKLDKAISFASMYHEGQYRDNSGIPYITHPLAVLRKLTHLKVEKEDIEQAIADYKIVYGAIRKFANNNIYKALSEQSQAIIDVLSKNGAHSKETGMDSKKLTKDVLGLLKDESAFTLRNHFYNLKNEEKMIKTKRSSYSSVVWID